MDTHNIVDNCTVLDWKSLNPIEFANYSRNHLDLWSKIEGAIIYHAMYGVGKISRVEQRPGYIPLIYIFFENDKETRTFNSDSFKLGVIKKLQISESQNDTLQDWKRQFAKVKKPQQSNKQICFADFGVNSLWHMTHFKNLNSIFQSGILSHREVRMSFPKFVDISDPNVQKLREKKPSISNYPIQDYVPLYVNPRNPMLYAKSKEISNLCLIEIDLKVLEENTFLFTDGNAASNKTRFFNKLSELKTLPWEVLEADYWSDKEDGKRKKCSEVLVYPKIEIEYIKALHFKDFIPSLSFGNKPIYITPKLYF